MGSAASSKATQQYSAETQSSEATTHVVTGAPLYLCERLEFQRYAYGGRREPVRMRTAIGQKTSKSKPGKQKGSLHQLRQERSTLKQS